MIPQKFRTPRVKTFALGGCFVLFVLASYPFLNPDAPSGQYSEGARLELAADGFAGAAPSGRMFASSVPVAKMAADRAAVAPQAERRIEETHRFTLTGDRDLIPSLYEGAIEACLPAHCEILSGSLNEYGDTLEARVSLRVEPDHLESFLSAAGIGREDLTLVTHERSAQDHTRQYQDVSARLDSLQALRRRLLALLESPTTRKTSDILEIEREIARTQGEIEGLSAQIREIEAVTDRTNVHLSFRNDRLQSAPTHPPYLANAFKEAGTIFERSMAQLVKVTASLSPLVIFAGLIWLLTFRAIPAILRRVRKHKS